MPLMNTRGNFIREESIIMVAGELAAGKEKMRPKRRSKRQPGPPLNHQRGHDLSHSDEQNLRNLTHVRLRHEVLAQAPAQPSSLWRNPGCRREKAPFTLFGNRIEPFSILLFTVIIIKGPPVNYFNIYDSAVFSTGFSITDSQSTGVSAQPKKLE
jgi:hypothetical protein